jgi:hypothetical protein
MILDNAKPRLLDAMQLANYTKENQEVRFIYNELGTHDTVGAVFMWILQQGHDFSTRSDEWRFVIIIHPKKPE